MEVVTLIIFVFATCAEFLKIIFSKFTKMFCAEHRIFENYYFKILKKPEVSPGQKTDFFRHQFGLANNFAKSESCTGTRILKISGFDGSDFDHFFRLFFRFLNIYEKNDPFLPSK
jgi:hypothetical protein